MKDQRIRLMCIAGYITQSVLSSILFVVAGLAMDKLNAQNTLVGGIQK